MDDTTRKQLKRFKKTLSQKTVVAKPAPRPELQPDDHALFMQAMRGVTPLADSRYPHPPLFPAPWPRQHQHNEARVTTETMSDFWPWDELETGEELLFTRPGLRIDTLKKLRRGEWGVQAELDLHGHTSDSARLALAAFLHDCRQRNQRCVRIIHGKGLSSKNREPVLKLKLKNWLAQRDEVLAFCQARPADGGSGAALVLLKGRKER
ncbi:DNA-nicking endonuclease, Smr domain [Formivibrio citricus]|uniref:DNA-nicking endonuclease, Smr domain n=1 Tax=Formivibrio citricus TaxID=83765 RepID=A0A1I4XFT5_9NEIS|nr:Smr/MutS family protein [Formivibrio citricus]SFN24129.1 DNA-nicking endonuclease, Smr domain [Formivibrio citricus]